MSAWSQGTLPSSNYYFAGLSSSLGAWGALIWRIPKGLRISWITHALFSIRSWHPFIKGVCDKSWLRGKWAKYFKYDIPNTSSSKRAVLNCSPGSCEPSSLIIPTRLGWVYCLMSEVILKEEYWRDQVSFVIATHAFWFPTIKWPCVKSRLGGKSVRYHKTTNVIYTTQAFSK